MRKALIAFLTVSAATAPMAAAAQVNTSGVQSPRVERAMERYQRTAQRNAERYGTPRTDAPQRVRERSQPRTERSEPRAERRDDDGGTRGERRSDVRVEPTATPVPVRTPRQPRVEDNARNWPGQDERVARIREERRDSRFERRDDRRDARIERRDDVRDGRIERRDDRRDGRFERRDDRRDSRFERRDDRRDWSRTWRSDRRYDWQRYRQANRNIYRIGRYYSPYRNYGYSRLSIGLTLGSGYYSSRYWLSDPWRYRLPPAYGGTQWVRYYNDVLLVDVYTGEVVDVIHDFFW